tara:strand:+ start:6718 stop:7521 length:804 start_codon:yes stop_codon:yes gene_type:complete
MRQLYITITILLLTLNLNGSAQAQFFDILKKEAKKAGIKEVQKAVGLNLPCVVNTQNSDVLTYCMKASLTNAITKDFGKILSGEDLSTHQSSVKNTIYTGKDQSWTNPDTGASGKTKITKEKTKTKKTKVVVLKDKVETVPPLDLIGENYQANSSINVRGGPGTDYKVVGKIASGDVVSVVGKVKDADWYMISQGGVGSGFVSQEFLTPAPTQDATYTDKPEGDLAEVNTKTTKTCKTIEQIVTDKDGKEKKEKITACQGPNGWEIV